jgi:hypothetical protein
MCWHLTYPIKWNEETLGICCAVFPDGIPKDIQKQLETRGYCRMKNEKWMEFKEKRMRKRMAEIGKMKCSDKEKAKKYDKLFEEF